MIPKDITWTWSSFRDVSVLLLIDGNGGSGEGGGRVEAGADRNENKGDLNIRAFDRMSAVTPVSKSRRLKRILLSFRLISGDLN